MNFDYNKKLTAEDITDFVTAQKALREQILYLMQEKGVRQNVFLSKKLKKDMMSQFIRGYRNLSPTLFLELLNNYNAYMEK